MNNIFPIEMLDKIIAKYDDAQLTAWIGNIEQKKGVKAPTLTTRAEKEAWIRSIFA